MSLSEYTQLMNVAAMCLPLEVLLSSRVTSMMHEKSTTRTQMLMKSALFRSPRISSKILEYQRFTSPGRYLISRNYLFMPVILKLLQIRGRQVLVQERLQGVTLGVAWPYLSRHQKESFKNQAREILRLLHTVKPNDRYQFRSHVVQDPNILNNGRINHLERNILFSKTNTDPDMSFMHNDFTQSNCIVDNDKIVGLIDWEMAGFFGWKTAGEVHRRMRTPQREHFANITLSEERLRDIMYWNDLYDNGMPAS